MLINFERSYELFNTLIESKFYVFNILILNNLMFLALQLVKVAN